MKNKIFVFEKTYDHFFGTTTTILILMALDKETATEYIKDKFALNVSPNELTWLMGADYESIYDQNGVTPLEKQVRILYQTTIEK